VEQPVALHQGQILHQQAVISKCIESENYRSGLRKSAGDVWCLYTSRHLNAVTCSAGDVLYHQVFTTQLQGCNYFCTWHALCTLYYQLSIYISCLLYNFSWYSTRPTTVCCLTHFLHKHRFLCWWCNFFYIMMLCQPLPIVFTNIHFSIGEVIFFNDTPPDQPLQIASANMTKKL